MAQRRSIPKSENARSVTGRAPDSDSRWWAVPIGDPRAFEKVTAHAKMLLKKSASRHSRNRARVRIYRGTEIANYRAAIAALDNSGITIARLNASKSIIDTYVSRLSKDKPMPLVKAVNADWYKKRKAEKFNEFIDAKWNDIELDMHSRDTALDGAILGNGITRIDDCDDDVFAENIPLNEILFDARELRYGMPRNAIRVRRMARDHLADLYEDKANEIWNAPASSKRFDEEDEDLAELGDLEDYVDVYEPWHLPTSAEDTKGRTGLYLENVTLCEERWHEPRFPWSHFKMFKPTQIGFWGDGFIDQLASLQHRVNCIVRDLQLNLAATGRGYFLVNEQNDIPTEMLTGWQPFKLKFKGGVPPTFQTPTPFNPAQLNMLEFFINQMFDLTGVSKANATSKSALGPGASGVALDTQYDIDSERFRLPQGNYADYRMRGGQAIIDASARIARKREETKGAKKSYVAYSWRSRDSVTKLEYSKVELKEGDYKVSIEAENFLPHTKAGKLAIVEQLAKAGVIPQWMVPALFDEPDITAANRLILAPYKNCLRKMDLLLEEDGELPTPEPLNDLDLELKICTAYYNLVQEDGAPPEICDRFNQYASLIAAAKAKKAQAGASMPGQVGPGGADPMAPAEGPLPGGVPPMPQGPVPPPAMIGAPAAAPMAPMPQLPVQ